MKPYYGKYDHGYPLYCVELERAYRPEVWNIVGVWVDRNYRGKGLAKKMLAQVTQDADREHVELWLSVMPGDKFTQAEGLYRLYAAMGFKRLGQESTTMIRKPHDVD